jgi:biopolymer transport protein ExbB
MSKLFDLVIDGGPVMVPLLGLSVVTFASALERAWFWVRVLSHERQIVKDVLTAAVKSLDEAATIATYAKASPVGRFLMAPLRLYEPTPETFHLALEASADREFVKMHKGDKLFETVVAIAPLLGLLGTVTGLIKTFSSLQIGGGSGTAAATAGATKAASGIGEALIATATGMIVAILALVFLRIFVTLQAQQMDYFTEVGNDLEVIYRQVWWAAKPLNRNLDNQPDPTDRKPSDARLSIPADVSR